MLGEEYFWDELGKYLGADHPLKHDRRENARGQRRVRKVNFCDDEYDGLRAIMMPISYNVPLWLQYYSIPLAKAGHRADVTIAKLDVFATMVEAYILDPCEKLERLRNGTYVLKGRQ